jgi:FlaA1/EpsC-like NDP-sugar epimerase
LLQMFDTNVLKPARLLRWISEKRYACRYFCVSTDKAANPVNFMGASKRVMEHVIFSGLVAPELSADVTSARFANVAFSDGSLLKSFLNRLEKRQPLAAPCNTRRYFMTLQEAGQICLLAATCIPHRQLLFSRFDPNQDLRDLESIAVALLRYYGLEPRIYENEADARIHLQSDLDSGRYPLLLTPLDTSGEKPYEEFVGEGERVVDVDMQHLGAVEYLPTKGSLLDFLENLERAIHHTEMHIRKEDLQEWMREIVPQFQHRETRKNLDQRM